MHSPAGLCLGRGRGVSMAHIPFTITATRGGVQTISAVSTNLHRVGDVVDPRRGVRSSLADTKDHNNGRVCHDETPPRQQNPDTSEARTLKIKLGGHCISGAAARLGFDSDDARYRLAVDTDAAAATGAPGPGGAFTSRASPCLGGECSPRRNRGSPPFATCGKTIGAMSTMRTASSRSAMASPYRRRSTWDGRRRCGLCCRRRTAAGASRRTARRAADRPDPPSDPSGPASSTAWRRVSDARPGCRK
jgi:hypothetical protein